MRSAETTTGEFRFANCALDPRSGELERRGVRIRLQHQPFQLLLLLLQRPGEVLSRDELTAQLWPQGTYVDFEHGLNAAIKRLRAALDDCAERPRFIETVPRRGYRFITPVESIDSGSTHRSASPRRDARDEPRLAVLRFSRAEDPILESDFSEGLAEALVSSIRRAIGESVKVVARAASRSLERDERTLRQMARVLRARYIVTGRVRQDRGRVWVSAELIDARDDTQLWADTYEQPFGHLFAIEARVAQEIASAVVLVVGPHPRAERRYPALAFTRIPTRTQTLRSSRSTAGGEPDLA